jgi:hypothetical protein
MNIAGLSWFNQTNETVGREIKNDEKQLINGFSLINCAKIGPSVPTSCIKSCDNSGIVLFTDNADR